MATSRAHAKKTGQRRWRRWLSLLFGVLVLATVVLVAAKFSELQRFAEIARNAQPVWLLAAITLQALTYVCAAGVWQATLWRAGAHTRFWSIILLALAKLFADKALPTGGVSGTVLTVTGLERRGVPKEIGMLAMLISLTTYYVAYGIAVIVALLILYSERSLNHAMLAAAALFALIALSIPTTVLGARRWFRHKPRSRLAATVNAWLSRIPGFSSLKSTISQVPGDRLRDPLSLSIALALQLLVFVCDAGTLWVVLQAMGTNGMPTVALAAFVMASLAATVGPVPLGLGTFEAVCVTVLHIQGLSVEVALTATLLLRGLTFWLPMAPGLLLARRELSQRPAPQKHASR